MGDVTSIKKAPGQPMTAPAPFASTHDVERFDCDKPPLNDWLKSQAAKSEGRTSRTFVVCEGRAVIGYYCLASGAIDRERAPKKLSRNTASPIPIIVIGRLAVDRQYQGKGIGSGLLKDALRRALAVSKEIGARCVLVHAIDDDIVPFYLDYGFKAFPTDARTMYMTMQDIVAAL